MVPAPSSPPDKAMEEPELDNESYVFDVDFMPTDISVQQGTAATVNAAVATRDADIQQMPSMTDASNTPKQTYTFVPKEVVP